MLSDLVRDFQKQTEPHLDNFLCESEIKWITSRELLSVTEESAEDFLSRDPVESGYDNLGYAEEVFEDFLSNLNYYYDKLIRNNKN